MSSRGDLQANLLCPGLHSWVRSSLFNCGLLCSNLLEKKRSKILKQREKRHDETSTPCTFHKNLQDWVMTLMTPHYNSGLHKTFPGILLTEMFAQLNKFMVIYVVCRCTTPQSSGKSNPGAAQGLDPLFQQLLRNLGNLCLAPPPR